MKMDIFLIILTHETLKLPEGIGNKVTRDKHSEKVPYLEIIEVILVHFNIVSNHYH